MTTLEHVLLGVNGVLATGLHRRYGWQLAAMTGVAATLPDWDGFAILGGMTLFDAAHRCWGHGLLPCLTVVILFAWIDYWLDLMTRLGRFFVKMTRIAFNPELLNLRKIRTWNGGIVWTIAAILAGLSHLFADIVFSGHPQYPHWGIPLFWPFSRRLFDWALVSWGDVGIMVIFVVGVFAMLRWKSKTQRIAQITLFTIVAYIVIRGIVFSS